VTVALPTYSTGTASVEAGSTVVTGAGVLWSGINVKQGDFIQIGDEPPVLIIEVTDDTHLKIQPWGGGPLPPIDSTAPVITSSAAVSVNEGVALAHTLTANETVTWSVVGGADATKVQIVSGNILRWFGGVTRDFETPVDADGNNQYVAQVRARDAALNDTFQTITITVLDVAETPGTTGTPIGLLLALTTTGTPVSPGTAGTPVGLLLALTMATGALRAGGTIADHVGRTIADAVDAPYVIYQNYLGRVVGVDEAQDVANMLERLRDQAPIYQIKDLSDPAGEAEPDPSYGTDGQFAYQGDTDKWWVMDGGEWVMLPGPPIGGGDPMPDDGLVYGRNVVAGTPTWTRAVPVTGDTLTGPLFLSGDPTAAMHAAAKQYVDAAIIPPPPPDAAMAYSGLQINGAMEVSQEKGAAVTSFAAGSANAFPLDGWTVLKTGSNAFTVAQVASVFPGYAKALKFTITTAQPTLGSGEYITIGQSIEGYRAARVGWGTAGAQPLTVGLWVRSSVAGTMIVQAHNGLLASTVYPTITAANVAQWVTVTLAAQTSGTWATDNSTGIYIQIYIALDGVMNIAATVGNTFEMTGVIVLPGSDAPTAATAPLLMRPYDQELLTCMRYFESLPMSNTANADIAFGQIDTGSSVNYLIPYKVFKRAVPTFTASSPGYFLLVSPDHTATSDVCTSLTAVNIETGRANVRGTLASATHFNGPGGMGLLQRNGTQPATIFFDARL